MIFKKLNKSIKVFVLISCIKISNQLCSKETEDDIYFFEINCFDESNSTEDKFSYTCDLAPKPIERKTRFDYELEEYNDFEPIPPSYRQNVIISTKNIKILHQSNLNFDNCKIEGLEITNGSIEKVIPNSFSQLNDLEKVDLSKNKIQYLSDGTFSNVKLKDINLSFNRIQNISVHAFYGIKSLDILKLSYNNLTIFDLPQLESDSIISLDLSFNNILKIGVSKNETYKIKYLDVSYNKMKSLTFLKLLDPFWLNRLMVSGNEIDTIPLNTFGEFYDLSKLNISNNKLQHLQFGVFNHLDRLETLDVSHNQLKSIDLHTIIIITNLEQLYVNDNELDTLDIDNLPPHLKYISFYNNKFNFTCKELVKLMGRLHAKAITSIYGNDFLDENVKGIRCKKSSNDTTGYNNQLTDNNDMANFSTILNSKFSILIKTNQENNRLTESLLQELKKNNNNNSEKSLNIGTGNTTKHYETLLNGFKQIERNYNNTSKHISEILNMFIKQKSNIKAEMTTYWNDDFMKSSFYKFFQNFKIQISNNKSTNSVAAMEKYTSAQEVNYYQILGSISNQFTVVIIILIVILLIYISKFKKNIVNQLFKGNYNTNSEQSATNLISQESLEM